MSKVWVPPHMRVRAGKSFKVKGHWRTAGDGDIATSFEEERGGTDIPDLDLRTGDNDRALTMREGSRVVAALIAEGNRIGMIKVAETHRRQGLATELLREAEERWGRMTSDDLTPDGRAWARGLGRYDRGEMT